MHCGGLQTPKHLAEGTVQRAQLALQRHVVVMLLGRWRMLARMPRGVREGALLCDQQ